MNKAPVALCYVPQLGEWRAAQTVNQVRGYVYEAVLFLQELSQEDRATVAAGLIGPKIIVNWEGSEALLDDYGIPRPYGREARVGPSEVNPAQVQLYAELVKEGGDGNFPRTPAGGINNCALANGYSMDECQMCRGECPDTERFL